MQPGDRVLAVQAPDQLRQVVVGGQLAQDAEQGGLFIGFLLVRGRQQLAHRESAAMRGDHVQQRGLGDAFGIQGVEQHGRRVGAAAGQGPGDPGDHARAARDHGFDEFREGFLVDEARQDFDIGDRRDLVGVSQRRGDRLDGAGAELAQFGNGLLGLRSGDIGRFLELRNEPVSPDVGEKTHGTDDPRPARWNECDVRARKEASLPSLYPEPYYKNYATCPVVNSRSGP